MKIVFRPLNDVSPIERGKSVCMECGALLLNLQKETHAAWHEKIMQSIGTAASTSWSDEA